MAVPILDNHVHLEPVRGRNVEAVLEFQRKGGTHLIVSHMPYGEVRVDSPEDFRRSYDITLSLRDRVNKETDVRAYATVGPYPVELIWLQKRHGLARAKEMMVQAMDIAAEYVSDGRALAIGEVGRPHFDVAREVMDASNEILAHGMALARKVGCAIVLHTESTPPEGMRGLAEMADQAGLPRERVVKHYCPPMVLQEENHGLMPSVLASREAAEEALSKGTRFMLETDFLDDPRRPGAVLAITTVPKRTLDMVGKGLMSEEQAHVIHSDNPRRTYGQGFS
jgi:TatD-related deoxyribonuclease